tara:strand:- start:885 stop:1898 length:1014 start_codon:yes stop_codon:yes gene_type:complete
MSNGTDPPFRGMLVESAAAKAREENKSAIEKGTNSSLDRMANMVNTANNTKSVINNYNPAQDFNSSSTAFPSGTNVNTIIKKDSNTSTTETANLPVNLNFKPKGFSSSNFSGTIGQSNSGGLGGALSSNINEGTIYGAKKEGLINKNVSEENKQKAINNVNLYNQREGKREGGGITTGGWNVADQFSKQTTGASLTGVGKEIARWAPLSGDYMDFAEFASDINKGDYKGALASGIGAAIPILPSKYVKKGFKAVDKYFNPSNVGKSEKMMQDMLRNSASGLETAQSSNARFNKIVNTAKKGKSKYKKSQHTKETFSGDKEQNKNIAVNNSGVVNPKG